PGLTAVIFNDAVSDMTYGRHRKDDPQLRVKAQQAVEHTIQSSDDFIYGMHVLNKSLGRRLMAIGNRFSGLSQAVTIGGAEGNHQPVSSLQKCACFFHLFIDLSRYLFRVGSRKPAMMLPAMIQLLVEEKVR